MKSLNQLTSNEHKLLVALNRGDSNKRIAADAGKSEQTVRNQFTVLFKKITATNRTQAVGWYRDQLARGNSDRAQNPEAKPGDTLPRRRFTDWYTDQRR